MAHISKDLQEDIIYAALDLLIASKFDKNKAMNVLRLSLKANHIGHINDVASFYSNVMDIICKNHNGCTLPINKPSEFCNAEGTQTENEP